MMLFRIGVVFDTGKTESRLLRNSTLDGAKLFASYYSNNMGAIVASVVRELDGNGDVTGEPFIYRTGNK